MKPEPQISLGKINRALASRRERIQRSRAMDRASCGDFYLVDTRCNSIVELNIDLAVVAKSLGIAGN